MSDQLSSRFSEHLTELLAPISPKKPHLIVALSGGLDSVVLLHLLHQLQKKIASYALSAHNVHHGLSLNADGWAEFCAQYCERLQVPLVISQVQVENKSRTSLEATARDARYQAFKKQMKAENIILTGHHQDDQLETLLLALKRGAGSTGLQGIKAAQRFHQGHLLRPLLIFSRQELADYAEHYQLDWVEDESNQNIDFDRNFIRQKVSPLLKQRWPQIMKTVSRTAQLCQEQQSLINEVAEQDLKLCASTHFTKQTLSIKQLMNFSDARRNNIIRLWLKSNGLQYPSHKQMGILWHEVALADVDKQPMLKLESDSIRRYQEQLYIVPEQHWRAPSTALKWRGEKVLWLVKNDLGVDFSLVDRGYAQEYQVECCLRQHIESGFTCLPEGRSKARSVKKLLHEYQVPPWLRDRVVFLFVNKVLIGAIGLWKCQGLKVPDIDVSLWLTQ